MQILDALVAVAHDSLREIRARIRRSVVNPPVIFPDQRRPLLSGDESQMILVHLDLEV